MEKLIIILGLFIIEVVVFRELFNTLLGGALMACVMLVTVIAVVTK